MADLAPPKPRAYPLPRPADDARDERFTFGLALDVAAVLKQHGYPAPTGRDYVELQQALFRFIYADEIANVEAKRAFDAAKGRGL